MTQIITFLQGRKAYIIAALLAVVSLIRLATGEITIGDFLNSPDVVILLNAAGLAATRAAISKQ